MLSVVSPEHRIRPDHPLRRIKALADAELARLSPVFDTMYAERGRRSIPPERCSGEAPRPRVVSPAVVEIRTE
jgi:hypothetical protein